MPIIILILIIVFFVPLVSALFTGVVALAGLLLLFLKAIPYIIAGIAVIWGLLFLLGKTINFGFLVIRKKTVNEIAKDLGVKHNDLFQENKHLLSKEDTIFIGRYYLRNGSYDNCERFQNLSFEGKEVMQKYIKNIFYPAFKKVRHNRKLIVSRR
ncbi:hypothetical protein [Bacillus sp. S/N-304-OC-R1]|uniref:hypothetical protein n=1 Tax=Bacillus sp. S/N-304-OC-R1 TaxID=2758034 RepID=UPI001C8E0A7C|nr:hypothetical protein [Bacillus sp. S/N-304-OC-R1]MBY0124515.1 hypothetical protein [Bacillus sp. S/N-304-OC-R1]